MRIRPCLIPLFMISVAAFLTAQTPDVLKIGQQAAKDKATSSSSPEGNTSENSRNVSSVAEIAASDPKPSVVSTGPSWDWTQDWQPRAAPEFLQLFQASPTDIMNAWVWNQAEGASNNISLFAAGVKENPGGAAAAAVDTSLTVFGALVDPSLELTFASAGASFTNSGLNASFRAPMHPNLGIIALPNKVDLMKQSAVPQSPPRLIVKMDPIPRVASPSFLKLEAPIAPVFAMPLIQTQPRLLVKVDSIQFTEPASSPTLFQVPKLSGGMNSVPLLQRTPHPTLGIGTFPIINPATQPASSTVNIVQPVRRLSPAVPTPAPRPAHK